MCKIEIFDGAMGTMLQAGGLQPGACPELRNIENPDVVKNIHNAYIEAGATIIETNTFGASPLKLEHYGLTDRMAELNTAAVKIAKAAAKGRAKVAGSMGPTGRFIEPLGDLAFDEAYDNFFAQAQALAAEIEALGQLGQRLADVPGERAHGIVAEHVEHDVRAVGVDGVEPAVFSGRKHLHVVGLAVLAVHGIGGLVVAAHLRGEEHAVGPHLDGTGRKVRGSIGDDRQRSFHFVAVSLGDLTPDERQIIADGCLINYYRNHPVD